MDVQAGLDAGANHHGLLADGFHRTGTHGVEHRGHNGGNDGAFDILLFNAVDFQDHLQVDAVFVGGFGCIRTKAGFESNFITLNTAKNNIRIANINGQYHKNSSKFSCLRIRQLTILPLSVSIRPALPP